MSKRKALTNEQLWTLADQVFGLCRYTEKPEWPYGLRPEWVAVKERRLVELTEKLRLALMFPHYDEVTREWASDAYSDAKLVLYSL